MLKLNPDKIHFNFTGITTASRPQNTLEHCLDACRIGFHDGMSANNTSQRGNVLIVNLNCWKRSEIDANKATAAQNGVELSVNNTESIAHQILPFQHMLLDILQLGQSCLHEAVLQFSCRSAEQRVVSNLHLACHVVQDVLDLVSLNSSRKSSKLSRDLHRNRERQYKR